MDKNIKKSAVYINMYEKDDIYMLNKKIEKMKQKYKNFNIKDIFINDGIEEEKYFKKLKESLKTKNIEILIMEDGKIINTKNVNFL